MHLPLVLAALQAVSVSVSGPDPASDTTRLRPDSAELATAYADEGTRELVRRARGHREVIDGSVFHYTATSRQRLSVGLRALMRDRILYRREGVSRIEWWRDRPGRVVVEGAREAVPVALPGVQVPEDLASWARDFVPQPGDERLWVNPSSGGFAWHPLVEGGEAVYTYASGDTTVLRLPEGDEVRLVELRVRPREPDVRLVTGTFWIETEDYGVVQAVFRPAREFDLERDLATIDPDEEGTSEEIPAVLRPIRFDARYIAIEYGLWEQRWWMPRLMALEGWVQVGPLRMPISMEVTYSDYTVEADRWGLPELPPLVIELEGDPYSEPRTVTYPVRVEVPDDTVALLESALLPPSLFSEGETLMSEAELRDLSDRLGILPPPPWKASRPTVTPPWSLGSGLLRYNRVEGVSAGARVDWDLTRLRLDLTARLGLADLVPRAEFGIERPGPDRTWRVAGYHRLAVVDAGLRPLGLAGSLSALLLGRDDGMYFRASGAEVRLEPAPGRPPFELRLYAERQGSAERNTDISLPHLAGGSGFRPNIAADAADQLGLSARLGITHGSDPVGWRWAAWADATAETGTYTFVRPGLTTRLNAPLPGELLAGLEVGAGSTLVEAGGEAPVQSAWFLGGPATLRGFRGGEIAGRDFLRSRLEVASEFPGARVAVFTDAGWAGRFAALDGDDVALSAGVGGSFLDGLLRLDLARAIRPVERWRLEFYLDALF